MRVDSGREDGFVVGYLLSKFSASEVFQEVLALTDIIQMYHSILAFKFIPLNIICISQAKQKPGLIFWHCRILMKCM